jgi:hypothetical protein
MTIKLQRNAASAAAACLAFAGIAALAPAARAENIVETLNGSWSGSGRIVYTDGSSEGIRCNAFYTGGGRDLSMAIQCKSDRNPIHIRSKLRIDGIVTPAHHLDFLRS